MAVHPRNLYRHSDRYRQLVFVIREYAQALYRTDPAATAADVRRDMRRLNQAVGFTLDLPRAGLNGGTLRVEDYRLSDDALQAAIDMALEWLETGEAPLF